MRLIHVKLEKIRNKLFVKIPELIAEALHLKEGEEIEISIHSEPAFAQGELWGDEPEEVDEIDDIYLDISEDLHTLNMYNRIYVPDFTKGVRSWVEVNGPLEPTDRIHVLLIDENRKVYEMKIDSTENI